MSEGHGALAEAEQIINQVAQALWEPTLWVKAVLEATEDDYEPAWVAGALALHHVGPDGTARIGLTALAENTVALYQGYAKQEINGHLPEDYVLECLMSLQARGWLRAIGREERGVYAFALTTPV